MSIVEELMSQLLAHVGRSIDISFQERKKSKLKYHMKYFKVDLIDWKEEVHICLKYIICTGWLVGMQSR